VFDCEDGYWFYRGRPLRDSGHSYGRIPVWEIIQKSSNIGTAKIALEMGEHRLYQTLYRFGFGAPTGVGFANEAPGIFRPVRKWDGLSITRFPIGQGVLATPLQMVQAYNALANEGVVMQLHVIDRIEDTESGLCETFSPTPVRRVAGTHAVREVVRAMCRVTEEGGTAPKAAVPGYAVAGKTGTAQKFVNGQFSNTLCVASFVGFVPADAPAFTLLVVADEPQKAQYGGTIAAPTFRRIAERTLRYLQIAPRKPSVPAPRQAEQEVLAHASTETTPRVR
jgi:cell division protein FtsI (penicillin-binding protein 3)/stage V sporulation protein D (sporulation-specific penicillin-binding protein)